MASFTVIATDTDIGKTMFSVLWLCRFAERYEYWKPVETGPSDTQTVARLVPAATVHPPVMRLSAPVAPPLAARMEGTSIPPAVEIRRRMPHPRPDRSLVVETFGGPFSPLNEEELQATLLQCLRLPAVLVSSSKLGAVGRTLSCLYAVRDWGIEVPAVVLIGEQDDYAAGQIARHGDVQVFSLGAVAEWSEQAFAAAAAAWAATLEAIADKLETPESPPAHSTIAEALLAKDRRFVWHPYTSLREPDPPLVVAKARDEFFETADGRRWIDGISSWWTILHGHRPPVLMQALAEAQREIDHVLFAGATHRYGIELAERLLASVGWHESGGRVFYSDNGSTAVEVALKMAYQHWCHRGEPQRTLFVGFENGYHGDTFGAMAASRDPVFFGTFEPLLFQTRIIPVDPNRLEEQLRFDRGKVAAVILEPLVQGAGGMQMYGEATLRSIAEVCRRHDVLLIADEVMTGGGRLGPIWASLGSGVVPDLICAAKTLAGGILSLAATIVAPHVVAAFDLEDRSKTFFHGHSFTAHPLACAVALANWRHLVADHLPDVERIEGHWRRTLTPLAEHPAVRDVRIRGVIAAVEVGVPGGYLAEAARTMRKECLRRGVFLRPLGNVLYAMPPLCTSEQSLERITEAMTAAVNAVATRSR